MSQIPQQPAPQALADFLEEYRRDNVASVSCANLFDAAAAMLRSQAERITQLRDAVYEAGFQAGMDRADIRAIAGDARPESIQDR